MALNNEDDDYIELPHNIGRVQRSRGLYADNEEAEKFKSAPKKRTTRRVAVKDEDVGNDKEALGNNNNKAKGSSKKTEKPAAQRERKKCKRSSRCQEAIFGSEDEAGNRNCQSRGESI